MADTKPRVTLYNRHSAPIDGVLPGAPGAFDDVPGVRRMVELGHLSREAPTSSPATISEVDALRARVAELEAASAAKAPKAKGDPKPAEG